METAEKYSLLGALCSPPALAVASSGPTVPAHFISITFCEFRNWANLNNFWCPEPLVQEPHGYRENRDFDLDLHFGDPLLLGILFPGTGCGLPGPPLFLDPQALPVPGFSAASPVMEISCLGFLLSCPAGWSLSTVS